MARPDASPSADQSPGLMPADGGGRASAEDSSPVEPDPPVYDERGNVRPRGTEGARPMTLAERKAIARKLHKP